MNHTIEKENLKELEKEIKLLINQNLYEKRIIDEQTYKRAKSIIISS